MAALMLLLRTGWLSTLWLTGDKYAAATVGNASGEYAVFFG